MRSTGPRTRAFVRVVICAGLSLTAACGDDVRRDDQAAGDDGCSGADCASAAATCPDDDAEVGGGRACAVDPEITCGEYQFEGCTFGYRCTDGAWAQDVLDCSNQPRCGPAPFDCP